jgi:hypothetical protein
LEDTALLRMVLDNLYTTSNFSDCRLDNRSLIYAAVKKVLAMTSRHLVKAMCVRNFSAINAVIASLCVAFASILSSAEPSKTQHTWVAGDWQPWYGKAPAREQSLMYPTKREKRDGTRLSTLRSTGHDTFDRWLLDGNVDASTPTGSASRQRIKRSGVDRPPDRMSLYTVTCAFEREKKGKVACLKFVCLIDLHPQCLDSRNLKGWIIQSFNHHYSR